LRDVPADDLQKRLGTLGVQNTESNLLEYFLSFTNWGRNVLRTENKAKDRIIVNDALPSEWDGRKMWPGCIGGIRE